MKPYYKLLIEKINEINIKESGNLDEIEKILLNTKKNKKRIYIIGNGGSISTAEHIANDFEKIGGLKVEALTNPAVMTAYGNDINYDSIFEEQLKNKMDLEDILIGITGSGNSRNIIQAFEYAKTKGITIGFLGFNGGKIKNIADYSILVNSDNYGIIEDIHLSLGHYFALLLKNR